MLARRLLAELTKLSEYGVALSGESCCYTLQYGGEVARAGNCLFDALAIALGTSESGSQVRSCECLHTTSPHPGCGNSLRRFCWCHAVESAVRCAMPHLNAKGVA